MIELVEFTLVSSHRKVLINPEFVVSVGDENTATLIVLYDGKYFVVTETLDEARSKLCNQETT